MAHRKWTPAACKDRIQGAGVILQGYSHETTGPKLLFLINDGLGALSALVQN